MTFLVRDGGRPRGRDVRDAAELVVRYGRKRRVKRIREVAGLGSIREVEDVGIDRGVLDVTGINLTANPRYHEGGRQRAGHNQATATAAGLKRVVRKLRAQEAERLAELDAEIARLNDDLRDARLRRQELLQEAFTKGHVLTLAEAKEIADEKEREVAKRRAEVLAKEPGWAK